MRHLHLWFGKIHMACHRWVVRTLWHSFLMGLMKPVKCYSLIFSFGQVNNGSTCTEMEHWDLCLFYQIRLVYPSSSTQYWWEIALSYHQVCMFYLEMIPNEESSLKNHWILLYILCQMVKNWIFRILQLNVSDPVLQV